MSPPARYVRTAQYVREIFFLKNGEICLRHNMSASFFLFSKTARYVRTARYVSKAQYVRGVFLSKTARHVRTTGYVTVSFSKNAVRTFFRRNCGHTMPYGHIVPLIEEKMLTYCAGDTTCRVAIYGAH